MMANDLNSALRAALGAVDVSAESDRLTDAQAELDRLTEAHDRADTRVRAITAELAAFKRDSAAIADALLDGAAAEDAAGIGPNREALEEERDALREAMKDLGSRMHNARNAIATAQGELRTAAAKATFRTMDDLVANARAKAQGLAEVLTCIAALGHASMSHGEVSRSATIILDGLMKAKLLDRADAVEVPADFRAALAPIEAISGLGARVPTKIAPYDPAPLAYAAAARAGFGVAEPAH